ncbi:MAG: DUF362 domain-containing protein [Dehalococcoidia bacterium]|nr:DUF362 domain-containing protein [Dehalococcoidia bacterium]
MGGIDRRDFLHKMLALGGGALATAAFISLLGCSPDDTLQPPTDNITPPPQPPAGTAYLSVARGGNPATLVQRAVDALGGIGRFVKPGDDVIVKPNICVSNRTPEYAATTNPEVVAALVTLCLGAGASRVRVMDHPFSGSAEDAYKNSGIKAAVEAVGGEMEVMASVKFQDTAIPNGRSIRSCRVYRDILKADVLIDVPIAKDHGNTILTLGMKNLLGVVDNAPSYHTSSLSERVVDLNTLVRPHLVVVDAIRVLMKNGPSGGNLSDVRQMDTIIASHDIVAADSYGATLFGMTGEDLPIVRIGAERGLGVMDLSSIKIEEIAA